MSGLLVVAASLIILMYNWTAARSVTQYRPPAERFQLLRRSVWIIPTLCTLVWAVFPWVYQSSDIQGGKPWIVLWVVGIGWGIQSGLATQRKAKEEAEQTSGQL